MDTRWPVCIPESMTGTNVCFEFPTELVAAHFRHHDVADNQIRDDLDGTLETFRAVFGFEQSTARVESGANEGSEVGIVFDQENDRLLSACGFDGWVSNCGQRPDLFFPTGDPVFEP